MSPSRPKPHDSRELRAKEAQDCSVLHIPFPSADTPLKSWELIDPVFMRT